MSDGRKFHRSGAHIKNLYLQRLILDWLHASLGCVSENYIYKENENNSEKEYCDSVEVIDSLNTTLNMAVRLTRALLILVLVVDRLI